MKKKFPSKLLPYKDGLENYALQLYLGCKQANHPYLSLAKKLMKDPFKNIPILELLNELKLGNGMKELKTKKVTEKNLLKFLTFFRSELFVSTIMLKQSKIKPAENKIDYRQIAKETLTNILLLEAAPNLPSLLKEFGCKNISKATTKKYKSFAAKCRIALKNMLSLERALSCKDNSAQSIASDLKYSPTDVLALGLAEKSEELFGSRMPSLIFELLSTQSARTASFEIKSKHALIKLFQRVAKSKKIPSIKIKIIEEKKSKKTQNSLGDE